jgi:methylenetetrahydrofolate reductase (NADPH)
MKISEIINNPSKPSLSFEVFPPKTDSAFETVKTATEKIAALMPSFMSVTYGAGGGTSAYTVSIASGILKNTGVTPLAHLTCVKATKESVDEKLEQFRQNGIENILALRGDLPSDGEGLVDFEHASQLAEYIRQKGDFCIGGACYPEGHPESASQKEDIANLRIKQDAGCSFLTTQMFFDNNIFYNFLFKVREAGITIPIIPGIMPVTNGSSILRTCKLSGTYLPGRFRQIVDHYGSNPNAMKQAGIAYATEQIIDLFANGIHAVHVYSMNKPDVAEKIQSNLSEILH